MKNIILGAFLAILLVFGYSYFKDQIKEKIIPTGETATSTPRVFEDGTNSVRMVVPQEFTIVEPSPGADKNWRVNSTTTGYTLVRVTIPREYQPNTNFSTAVLTVGRSSDPIEIRNCTKEPMSAGIPTTIQGVPFTKFSFSTAGAGNFYETTSYRTIYDGDCYVVEYTIHSTALANYEPSSLIVAFDKERIVSEMEKIVQSITLLINSDSPVACTMEAKICSDGTGVGRVGPRCEFAPCPGVFPAGQSGVYGQVTIGPTCPVMQYPPQDRCADRPYQTTLLITSSTGKKQYVSSNSLGRYEASMEPGTYTISAGTQTVMPSLAPETFVVKKDVFQPLNLTFDSGIR